MTFTDALIWAAIMLGLGAIAVAASFWLGRKERGDEQDIG